MTTRHVFEGKDLEEALQQASSSLGIDEPDLDYKILEQGRRGLFGLGAKSVKIRVMPPVERLTDEELDRAEDPPPDPPKEEPAVLTDEGRDVQATVERMMGLMGLDLKAEARGSDAGLTIELDGPDRKMLAQKDGELSSALQFILNRMARRAWPAAGRIHVASGGQRKERDSELIELTREVAQQVRDTGKAKRLHPMNAYERRLVHITIREETGLGSRSEGNGYLKRVRIFKQGKQSRQNRQGRQGRQNRQGRRNRR